MATNFSPRTFCAIAFTLGLTLPAFGSAAATWHTGDAVKVYVSGSCCYPGKVVGIGSGAMAGYYLIHFDNPASHDQYAKAENVIAQGSAAGSSKAAKGSGKLHCVMGTIGGKPVCFPTAAPH